MKNKSLVAILFAGAFAFAACEKNDSSSSTTTTTTTTSTTSTTGNNSKTPEINEMIINDTAFQFVNTYGNAQTAGDYSYYGTYADSSSTIDIRALFNPIPSDTAKTYNVITGNTPTASDVQLTLTYNGTNSWVAVSGGTVNVKTNQDSTFIEFLNITFRKQGNPNKVVSAKIYSPK